MIPEHFQDYDGMTRLQKCKLKGVSSFMRQISSNPNGLAAIQENQEESKNFVPWKVSEIKKANTFANLTY